MANPSRPASVADALSAVRPALLAAAAASAMYSTPETGTGEPEFSDEVIRENTGHTWAEWVKIIDEGPGREAGHTAIATWVHDNFEINGWWAQGVTVSYERLVGLRLPGQMADGTFTAQKNKTLDGDRDALRAWWVNDGDRAHLLPGLGSTLRSKPASKVLKVALTGPDGAPLGTLGLSIDEAKSRLKLNLTHEKLPSAAAAEAWKQAWGEWVEALAAALGAPSAPARRTPGGCLNPPSGTAFPSAARP